MLDEKNETKACIDNSLGLYQYTIYPLPCVICPLSDLSVACGMSVGRTEKWASVMRQGLELGYARLNQQRVGTRYFC